MMIDRTMLMLYSAVLVVSNLANSFKTSTVTIKILIKYCNGIHKEEIAI